MDLIFENRWKPKSGVGVMLPPNVSERFVDLGHLAEKELMPFATRKNDLIVQFTFFEECVKLFLETSSHCASLANE